MSLIWDDPPIPETPPKPKVLKRFDPGMVSFTDDQLTLQSFIASGFIEPDDVIFAKRIAYEPDATQTQLDWVKIFVNRVLGEPVPLTPPPLPPKSEQEKIKYQFKNLFSLLEKIPTKRIETTWEHHKFKMSIATNVAKYPGAIYLVSERPGYGYVGRIEKDHSVVIPNAKISRKELINFLMFLDKHYKPAPETLPQQLARGPFDPAIMNEILNEYGGLRK